VSWGGGETPSLAGVVAPGAVDLAASCVGLIRPKSRLTLGDALGPGDAVVLLASSGLHANGVTLARKVAERLPQGLVTPLPDGRPYGEALLVPTVLYSPVTEALFAAGVVPHYAANVTGHGWRKLMRHPAAFTYRFRSIPPAPAALRFAQQHAGIDDREAYGTFNMGAGFALYVRPDQADAVVRIAHAQGVEAWVAGVVEAGEKRVIIEPLGIEYGAGDLHVRA
jgi:phosphoribosylformylglycinamidine cyclo-ligase